MELTYIGLWAPNTIHGVMVRSTLVRSFWILTGNEIRWKSYMASHTMHSAAEGWCRRERVNESSPVPLLAAHSKVVFTAHAHHVDQPDVI